MNILGFFKLAKNAINKFPAAKWLFGVIGVIAVIGLAKATSYSWQVFVFGAIGVLLCGGMLLVAAAAYERQKQQKGYANPSSVFIWLCLLFFAVWSFFFTGCVFFDWPKSPSDLFGVQKPGSSSNPSNRGDAAPAAAREPMPVELRTELDEILGQFVRQIDNSASYDNWRSLPVANVVIEQQLRDLDERWKKLKLSTRFKWPDKLTNDVACLDLAFQASFARLFTQLVPSATIPGSGDPASSILASTNMWARTLSNATELFRQIQTSTGATGDSEPVCQAKKLLSAAPSHAEPDALRKISLANALAARQAYISAREGFRAKLNP